MNAVASRRPLLLLLAGAAVLAVALGVRHAFGLFLQPIIMAHGWSRETFALAIALQNIVWGLAQPATGMLADRFGPGRVMLAGLFCYASGLALMAAVASTTIFIRHV